MDPFTAIILRYALDFALNILLIYLSSHIGLAEADAAKTVKIGAAASAIGLATSFVPVLGVLTPLIVAYAVMKGFQNQYNASQSMALLGAGIFLVLKALVGLTVLAALLGSSAPW